MKITKITSEHIYCYQDYGFLVFDRNCLITGAEVVGMSWTVGKHKDLTGAPVEFIKKDSSYHNMIIMELIGIAEHYERD